MTQNQALQTVYPFRIGPKICNHPVFHSLRKELVAKKITVCPSCLIRRHIFDISRIQAGIQYHGGAFALKAAANDAPADSIEKIRRKTLRKRWIIAKLDLCRDLYLLEDLRAKGGQNTRWELQLSKAFEVWDEAMFDCSRVPGCKYIGENVSDVIDGCEPNDEPKMNIEHDLNQVTDPNEPRRQRTQTWIEALGPTVSQINNGWEALKSWSGSPKQRSAGEAPSKPSTATRSEDTNMEDASAYIANPDVQDPDDIILDEMEDVTSKLESGSSVNGRNRSDSLFKHADHEDLEVCSLREACGTAARTSSRTSDEGSAEFPDAGMVSALKSKLSGQRSPKSVRMAELVNVVCSSQTRDTTNHSSQQISYNRPHSPYTTAETSRKRCRFNRTQGSYEPSTWACPDGAEYVNTSHLTTPWEVYAAVQLMAYVEELVEEGKVNKVDLKVDGRQS